MPTSNKSRKKLTQEDAEKRVEEVLRDTPYELAEPLDYNGCRNTRVYLHCRKHNTYWNVAWSELCIRSCKREKYCGCKECKLVYPKEKCFEVALKCKYRSEFSRKYKGEYFAALRNGWLDEICSHMTHLGNKYNRCIYVYEFPNVDGLKYAYVGLTDHIEKRDKMHGRKGTLFNFCNNHNVVRPPMKVLTDYLPKEEAQHLEGEFLQKYIDEGWLPINLKKTGGLGGHLRFSGYTFEECKNAGKNYTSRSIWRDKDYSTYYVAQKFGWLDDIIPQRERFGNSQQSYWTKEMIEKRALDYNTLREFREAEPSAYAIACREGWSADIFKHLRRKYVKHNYTLSQIKATLNQYDTTTDFVESEPAMYNWCVKNKIRLTDISNKPVRKSKYKRKYVYQYALDGKLVAEYTSAREAALHGFDFKKISLVCQGKRRQHNGYIFSFSPDGVTPVEIKPKKPKKEKTLQVIKHVQQFSINGEFLREFASTREAAEITGVSAKAIQGNVAHKTHTASGFIFKYSDDKSEVVSRINIRSPKCIPVIQYELDGTFVKEWASINEAEKALYTNGKGHITEVCKGKRPSAKGFIWKYKE